MNKFYLLLFLTISSITACKTASKAYDKGDYSNAIELAVKKLQKDPNDGETKALAQNAYRQAVRKHEERIRQLSNSNSERSFEQIYHEYRQLQDLYNLIQKYPTIQNVVNAKDYSDYISTYRNKTAEVYFQKGLARMNENTKRASREAYQHFRNALKYKDDTATRNRMEEAYEAAVIKIVILPMNEYMYGGGYRQSNSYQFRNFENELIRNLRHQMNSTFVQFYSEWDARGKNIQPDEILDLRLGRIDVARPYDENKTRTVSKEVVVKETVFKPDSVVKEYRKVTAQITTTRRTYVSEGELYITSRDAGGRILWNDVIRGGHRFQTQFATYRGDERALSESDRSLLNRQDNYSPREDEVMEAVLRQIENEMGQRMRNYYSRYN